MSHIFNSAKQYSQLIWTVVTSKTDLLKLYTIYSPPNHPSGTVHKTKAEAEAAEAAEHHDTQSRRSVEGGAELETRGRQ